MIQTSIFRRFSSFLSALLLAGAACWALLAGIRLGIVISDGGMRFPGPGLWPALAGGGLLICAACGGRAALPFPKEEIPASEKAPDERRAPRASLTGLALACLAWLCLTPLIGWFAATAAALYLAARAAGSRRKSSALLSLIFPALLYLAIVRGLGWPLPEGLIWSLS